MAAPFSYVFFNCILPKSNPTATVRVELLIIGGTMTKIGAIVTIVGSAFGAVVFIIGFLGANGAPQEAAAAAAGVALAVIPYCFARALAELGTDKGHS